MAEKKKIADKVDKRRRAKVVVGHLPDGTPVKKYASGRTAKELAENKAELKRKYTGGAIEVQRDVLFGKYAVEWYDVHKKPELAESTRANYATMLNKHIIPAFGDRQLRAITATDLRVFMNTFSGMGRTTIGDAHSALQNIFARAYDDRIIEYNPAAGLKKPKAKSKKRRALTDDEAAAALKVAQSHEHGLLLLILYYTGARRGEALGLQWRDIDFKAHKVYIRRDIDAVTNDIGDLKSEASERWVPLVDELAAALNKCKGFGETFIIQSPQKHSFVGKATYERHWKELMIAVYETDKSIEHRLSDPKNESSPMRSILTAHYFRHNYATILYNAGFDVLKAIRFMGHADAKMIMDIYAHLDKEQEKSGTKKINNIFKKVAKRLPANASGNDTDNPE